jgi:parvulin-like peptidyl-prolyl isomerase
MLCIQIGSRHLTAETVCQHLSSSRLLPQFLGKLIIDRTISEWQPASQLKSIELDKEVESYVRQLQQLPTTKNMSEMRLRSCATQQIKLQQFKLEQWGDKLISYFLVRKSQLDRAIYSIIQVKDRSVAQELFFIIQSDRTAFAKLARKYSQGTAALDGGKLGPYSIANIHPIISDRLVHLTPGQLSPLLKLDNFYILLRLEELIPARFDNLMKQFLLDELFESWLQERVASEIGSTSIVPPIGLLDRSTEDIPPSQPRSI